MTCGHAACLAADYIKVPPIGGSEQDEVARARAAARAMSDPQLEDLHRQGSSAFAPGAWQVLDDEVHHRRTDRRVSVPLEDDTERYPALRAIAFLLKAVAVIVFLVTGFGAFSALLHPKQVGIPGPLSFVLIVAVGVILTLSYWASAEVLVLLMDIERNTRLARRE